MRPAEEIFTDEVVEELMVKHGIPKLARNKFEEALWAAHGTLESTKEWSKVGWGDLKIPKSQDRKTFYNQLSKANKILAANNGLEEMLALSALRPGEKEHDEYFSWLNAREQVQTFKNLMPKILALAEIATKKKRKGRKKRYDVRSAAMGLIYFLDKDLGYPLSMQDRGAATNALKFVHNCLSLMDPSITKRLLEEIDAEIDPDYKPIWLPNSKNS